MPVCKALVQVIWRNVSDSVVAHRRMIRQACECNSLRKKNAIVEMMDLAREEKTRNLSMRAAGANGLPGVRAIVLAGEVLSIE